MSLYGHNEELFRKVGEPVTAGDVIGSVGDSGGHNQPALYFEVRRGRSPVNPETWLREESEGPIKDCPRPIDGKISVPHGIDRATGWGFRCKLLWR